MAIEITAINKQKTKNNEQTEEMREHNRTMLAKMNERRMKEDGLRVPKTEQSARVHNAPIGIVEKKRYMGRQFVRKGANCQTGHRIVKPVKYQKV